MNRHLHIVCLDVPWPADYGGAIDMMNRIIAFYKQGVKIHLHYFSYNDRGKPNELNQYCDRISVYERRTGMKGLSRQLPYIVASRINEELVKNLLADEHPVLLEGLHCTGILPRINNGSRKIVVRIHNEEAVYYRELARAERSLFRKIHFRRESKLLARYTRELPANCTYACISEEDAACFRNQYGLRQSVFVPAFPSWQEVHGQEGSGSLCLFHGNLSVPENEEAAVWLLQKVFSQVRKPFVIAGKDPSKRLQKLAHIFQHTCIVANPSDGELNDLVRKAHINILPCFNKEVTGIRIKLLHALFEGRHVVVNEAMVKGTGLATACHAGSSAEAIASIVTQLYFQPFTAEEVKLRKMLLEEQYNNERNTRLLSQYLW